MPAMIDTLTQRNPMDLDDLAAELSGRFDVAESSVRTNANMDPIFVIEGNSIGLRPTTEPHVPKTKN